MDSEEKMITSFLFKRSGKDKLKESDICLSLSIDLGWFTYQQAKEFVKHILKQKLLMRKEGVLSPTFDIENVVIPAGFYPSKKSFTEEKQTQVNIKNMDKKNADSIVQRIAKKTDKDVKKVAIKIEEIADEKKILPEVAALLVAMEENVEVKDCFDAVESAIFIGENEE